jgi:hypothetical protein
MTGFDQDLLVIPYALVALIAKHLRTDRVGNKPSAFLAVSTCS